MGADSRDDAVRARRLREGRLADALIPRIWDEVRNGADLLALSERLAVEHGLDASTAYRWVHLISERFEIRRRRWATGAALVMWLGAGLLLAAVVRLLLIGVRDPLMAAAGVLLSGVGVGAGLLARRFVRLPREWR